MKRFLLAIVCISSVVYVFSCSKSPTSNQVSCTGPKASTDSTQLLAFAKKNGINPVADTSFLYYEVINPGTGATPGPNSIVYVRYAGRLITNDSYGPYFDSTATAIGFPLNGVIKGFQYGLPKIKTGGRIKLLVPSALGYGCAGYGNIPASTPLYFDVYLDSLK